MLVSAFLSGVLFLQNRFFWYYPNETLSPFPWRQSQNCQVSTLSKILWGVFCNCQGHVFKRHIVPFQGEPFIFGEFSQFVNPFIKTLSITVLKDANTPTVE